MIHQSSEFGEAVRPEPVTTSIAKKVCVKGI